MSPTDMTLEAVEVTISGASDDTVEFYGAICGEAWVDFDSGVSRFTLKSPDGTKLKGRAEFCGSTNTGGWKVIVDSNPGGWDVREVTTQDFGYDGCDFGIVVRVTAGTTAKCDGRRVR